MTTRLKSLYEENKISLVEFYKFYRTGYVSKEDFEFAYHSKDASNTSQLKLRRLVDLEIWYLDSMKNGFPVPDKGYNIALEFDDRTSFTQQLTLLQQLLPMNAISMETELKITDINKNEQTITVGELIGVLVQYGIYYQTIWGTYTGYQKYILELTDTPENHASLLALTF